MITGYYFAIIVKKEGKKYISTAPGVGGVYEEGFTKKEAIDNAYESAIAILQARKEFGYEIKENNEYLKILTSTPTKNYLGRFNELKNATVYTIPPSNNISYATN